MWAWVISDPCHLGHMVQSRVAGVAVGRRDLNWERACLGYDANDLSLQLEGIRLGACGHGSCLVPVT